MASGVSQFKDWLQRRGFSQREGAAYFGWDETELSHMLAGRRTPGLTKAIQIERLTGIPVEAWVSSPQDTSAEPAPAHPGNAK